MENNVSGFQSFVQTLNEFLSIGTNILFDHVVFAVFVVVALLFTILIKGAQFKYALHAGSLLFAKHHGGGTSGFASYAISTASRVGTGNMAGIMVAITAGGPGALFWMWIMALFGSALAFAEATIAQLYKEKNSLGHYVGGASYYIRSKLKLPIVAVIFALIMIVTYTAFNGVQANTIAGALSTYNVSTEVTAIVLVVLTAIILFYPGRTSIIKVCTYIIPVMAVPYLLLGLFILFKNFDLVPAMISTILKDAFSGPEAAGGGFLGAAVVVGLKRGLFSNEAGMGGAPHAAAAATTTHPARQGFIQMFSVFTDTLLICSISGFILLLSPEALELAGSSDSYNGIKLMQFAMGTHFGTFGSVFVTVCVLLFSFSSILGNFFYIQTGATAIKDNVPSYVIVVLMTLVLVYFGSIVDLSVIWNLGDFLMGFMALLNIATLILLYKPVKALLENYISQWNKEQIPVYIKGDIPEIEDDAITQWNGQDSYSIKMPPRD